MLAEIRNKISRTGSNLSERLEDGLTGNFFGAIRYLPFELGLKLVLQAARFELEEHSLGWEQTLDSISHYDYELLFWYRHAEGEIDLVLNHPKVVVGIEVKYLSGLSSDDEEPERENSSEESCNQLARYSRMLSDIQYERSAYLLFLAPYRILLPVEMDMKSRSVISPGIKLGYLAWQNVLEQLQSIELSTLDTGHKRIIKDLIDLLVKKGFERFKGFHCETQQIELSEQAYSFNGNPHKHFYINWPLKTLIREDCYAYHK